MKKRDDHKKAAVDIDTGHDSALVYKLRPGNQEELQLSLYNIIQKAMTQVALHRIHKLDGFDSVLVKNELYFCGGSPHLFSPVVVKSTFVYNISTRELTPKCDMLNSNHWHTLVALNQRHIYCLGGHRPTGRHSDCEKYDVVQDKWMVVPPLHERKCHIAATTFSNRFIFTFGGESSQGYSRNMERLDVCEEEEGWLLWLCPTSVNPRRSACIIQRSLDSILIFGGAHTSQRHLFRLFPLKLAWNVSESNGCDHYMSLPVLHKGIVYVYTYSLGNHATEALIKFDTKAYTYV